jgi:nuclear transport factor 2 (NTF2) superfamily protein
VADQRPAVRLPVPPFDEVTARAKVQAAEDAWNSRDPVLTRKWNHERDYALRKSLWAFEGNRIAVRFQYEWRDETGQWWRSYGNENWEFDPHGYLTRREASINDVAIAESDRRISGPRGESDRDQVLPLA